MQTNLINVFFTTRKFSRYNRVCLSVFVFVLILLFFSCTKHDRDNPFDPQGTNWAPPVVTPMPDTSVAIYDSFYVHAVATSPKGTIVHFIWTNSMVDSTVYKDTTTEGKIKIAFPYAGDPLVKVKAIDNKGIVSVKPCRIKITVHYYQPTVIAMNDTNVAINDSFYIHATGSDTNGTIIKYLWALDGINYKDSTDSGRVKAVYTTADVKTVRVKVRDDDGIESAVDSVKVIVHLYPPLVISMNDTTVSVNDSFYVHAEGGDSNGTVNNYIWAVDGVNFIDTTHANKLIIKATFLDTGEVQVLPSNKILVKVIDDDEIVSEPCSINVNIRIPRPWVIPMSDTMVMVNDSFTIHAEGHDSNGTIVKYYWALDSVNFKDTTMINNIKISFAKIERYSIAVQTLNDKKFRSTVAWIKVIVKPPPPWISTQPQSQTVSVGENITLSVVAFGTGTLSYQWNKSGIEILGAISNSFALNNVQRDNSGIYTVSVSNDGGSVMSKDAVITVIATPTITTQNISSITSTTATCGGNIISDGGGKVTARGICYNTSPNPTTINNKITCGSDTGSFTANMTGLIIETTYYVRAYATNSAGTAYGAEMSFATRKYLIGDLYGGGIIFYIDGTGKHGLIAAPSDQSTSAEWDCGSGFSVGGTNAAIGSGSANTTRINTICASPSIIGAARICQDLVLGGYSDWFLPSKDELNLLYQEKNLVGGFASISTFYWSSTEYNSNWAWYQQFINGTQDYILKDGTYCVRAIRAF